MAIRHSRFALSLQSLAFRYLPASIFINSARIIYPLLNRHRRWPSMDVRRVNDRLFRIKMDDEQFFFYEHTRIERYLWPDSVQNIRDKMMAKYSFNDISVSKGDLVIDIGANVGEFTQAVAPMTSHVISVEPDPIAYECLKRNSAMFNNVTTLHGLVSDKDENRDFYISSRGADSSIITPADYDEIVTVESRTLDALLEEMNVSHVDFLKIEAEGGEPEVLMGARNTLSMTSKIAVDCGPERHGIATSDAVREILGVNNFKTYENGNMIYAKK